MKKWIIVFVAGLLVSCADNDTARNISENNIDSTFITEKTGEADWSSSTFKELYGFYKVNDPSFNTVSFELVQQSTLEDYPAEAIDINKLQPFSKLISYNTDSTFGVDVFSYNYLPGKIGEKIYVQAGEPDMEASLIDVKEKERKRLLYLGPSYILFEGQWLNRNEIVIAGAEIISENKIKPLLWKITLPEKAAEMYSYSGIVQSNVSAILATRLAHADLFLK